MIEPQDKVTAISIQILRAVYGSKVNHMVKAGLAACPPISELVHVPGSEPVSVSWRRDCPL